MDNIVLERMLEELGIVYSSLVNLSKQTFLEGSRWEAISAFEKRDGFVGRDWHMRKFFDFY